MTSNKVLVEWRTNDRWNGMQQPIKRKDIDPADMCGKDPLTVALFL